MSDDLSVTSISLKTNYREYILRSFITALRKSVDQAYVYQFPLERRATIERNPLSWNYAAPNKEMKPCYICISSFDKNTDLSRGAIGRETSRFLEDIAKFGIECRSIYILARITRAYKVFAKLV